MASAMVSCSTAGRGRAPFWLCSWGAEFPQDCAHMAVHRAGKREPFRPPRVATAPEVAGSAQD
jgi:hypothetical protein